MISLGILGWLSSVGCRQSAGGVDGSMLAGGPGAGNVRPDIMLVRSDSPAAGTVMSRVVGPEEDSLSGVLRDVKVRSVVYCLSDFAAPWGFSVERSPVAKFHVLLHGAAALTAGDAAPVPLAAGDLAVLPHGDG